MTKKELAESNEELNTKIQYLAADFDNMRKRCNKRVADSYEEAKTDIVKKILPVIDDIERMEYNALTKEDSLGAKAIKEKFIGILSSVGVEQIAPNKGDVFNVDEHEAVAYMGESGGTPVIFDCMEKGYKLGGKIIRFSKVVCGNGAF